ncbi:MAG TPA: hypothetical protein VFW02_09750 [Candidatus Limnocylindrales bacterium]|nr:hypothetical protein [Candidatus Limnocylindrales bacterium]
MAEPVLHALSEPELESALRDLGPSIAWPTAGGPTGGPDLAAVVRARIESMPPLEPRVGTLPARWLDRTWRPARRALILALVALLALAALAGAVGLGLPGLRLILGEPPVTPPPTLAPTVRPSAPAPAGLGASMGLGEALDPSDTASWSARAGFEISLPADPAIGPPKAAYIDEDRGGQITLLWPAGPDAPATSEREVGLLLSEFVGAVDRGFYTKAIGAGTVIEPVRVDGHPGYWISGEPHVLFWDGPSGFVDDQRRWVGDVLIWSDGPITFRLESALGREEAIRIAESVP